jgi:hypothetical protein
MQWDPEVSGPIDSTELIIEMRNFVQLYGGDQTLFHIGDTGDANAAFGSILSAASLRDRNAFTDEIGWNVLKLSRCQTCGDENMAPEDLPIHVLDLGELGDAQVPLEVLIMEYTERTREGIDCTGCQGRTNRTYHTPLSSPMLVFFLHRNVAGGYINTSVKIPPMLVLNEQVYRLIGITLYITDHYFANVRHPQTGVWINMDDSNSRILDHPDLESGRITHAVYELDL